MSEENYHLLDLIGQLTCLSHTYTSGLGRGGGVSTFVELRSGMLLLYTCSSVNHTAFYDIQYHIAISLALVGKSALVTRQILYVHNEAQRSSLAVYHGIDYAIA